MVSIHLAPKFDPYIINNQDSDLHSKLDEIFHNLVGDDAEILSEANGFQPLGDKTHVVAHPDLPDWIIKGPRHDNLIATLPDTHIYRVRRATRFQNVMRKHGFSEVVVPKKMLYQHNNQWFVIAEKLKLDEKATLNPDDVISGKKQYKMMTPEQAKEIATLCFEGKLEDIGEHNLNFTEDGKIALVDTEPTSRAIKKTEKLWFSIIPNLKLTFLFTMNMMNSEDLYRTCQSDGAREDVRRVQSWNFGKHLIKLITKVALPLIFSIGALSLANPVFTGVARAAVVVSGVNALVGLVLIITSIWFYRSP